MPSPRTLGLARIAFATTLFSLNPSLFRLVSLGPLELFWTVNALAAVALTAHMLRRRELGAAWSALGARPRLLVALVAVFTLNNLLFISAIKVTTVANAVLTHYSAPVFVFLFGARQLREPLSGRSGLALACALGGLVCLVDPASLTLDSQHTLGLCLGLGSAVFFAQEIVLKKLLVRDISAPAIVLVYLGGSVVVLVPFLAWPPFSIPITDWGLVALSGVVVSGFGIPLFTSGLGDVRAQQASMVSYIEPIGSIMWGVLFVGEYPPLITLVGGALILAGTYLVVWGPPD